MDLPGNPISHAIQNLLSLFAPRHVFPTYRSIEQFMSEQPELMDFFLQEYPKLANTPDPDFEHTLERLKEACSCFSIFQLANFMACPQDDAQCILTRKRLPSAWLLFAAFTRGANPFWILSGEGTPCIDWNYSAARCALDALEKYPLITRMLKRTAQWAARQPLPEANAHLPRNK